MIVLHTSRIFTPIITFILGSYITLFFYFETCSKQTSNKDNFDQKSNNKILLLALILSAPGNTNRRQTIRETWLQNSQNININLYLDQKIYVPEYNEEGFIIQPTIEQQRNQYKLYYNPVKHKIRSKLNDINVHSDNIYFMAKFLVGIANQPIESKDSLQMEQQQYNDLILLKELEDSYESLTQKLIGGLWYAVDHYSFEYILKCDDDSYVRLNEILPELRLYNLQINQYNYGINPRPILYWGYFNGRAQIKSQGKWKESNYMLCNNYLPYALGGGYIISYEGAKFIANNANILSAYISEDISMGVWLSALRNVYRKHDIRFDTAYKARKCQDYHIILHKCSIDDMRKLYQNSFQCSTKTSTKNTPKEYFYNWRNSPLHCCDYYNN